MATIQQIGRAQNVAQVDTITIGGTPTASTDTVSVTCNFKTATLTAGSTLDTVEEIAAAVAEMINATHHDDTLFAADFTCNVGGQEIYEFRDFKATASGAVVTIESVTPGWPFTITVAKSGTLTATHVAEATAATGQWHFDNADNYSASISAADTIVYDEQSSGALFALDNTTLDLSIHRRNGFTENIGLPPINRMHSPGYPEYRKQSLDTPVTSSSGSQHHKVGEKDASTVPQGFTFLDMGTVTGDTNLVNVYDAPANGPDNMPAVRIAGGKKLTLNVYGGSVGVGVKPNDNTSNIIAFQQLNSGRSGNPPNVLLGEASAFTSSNSIRVEAGNTVFDSNASGPDGDIYGGTLTMLASFTNLNIYNGGKVEHVSGNISTACMVYAGGEFDSRSGDSFTLAALTLYKDFIFRDREKASLSSGIDFAGCSPADGVFDVQPHKTWTPTAI